MDPTRVHAYLQAACAGLGFDIGEVWFSANQTGTSTVAAIGKSQIFDLGLQALLVRLEGWNGIVHCESTFDCVCRARNTTTPSH